MKVYVLYRRRTIRVYLSTEQQVYRLSPTCSRRTFRIAGLPPSSSTSAATTFFFFPAAAPFFPLGAFAAAGLPAFAASGGGGATPGSSESGSATYLM